MVECYIAEEAMEFCIEYLLGIDAIGIPSDRRNEWKLGKPMPGGQIVTIDLDLLLQAHHYILENTTIV